MLLQSNYRDRSNVLQEMHLPNNDDAKLKDQADLAKQKQSKFGVDKTVAKKEYDEEDQIDEGEEEYEPEVEFEPVIPLPDLIDVETGEENETVLLKKRCKLHHTHKLCANFNLTKSMPVNKMLKNNKATQWICKDYSEGELAHEQFSAKFESSELADKFVSLFTEATAQGKYQVTV